MFDGWLKGWECRLGDRRRTNTQARYPKEGKTTGQAEASRCWRNEETLRRKIVHCRMNVELVSFLNES
jgi:hypothetical protein